MKKLYVSFIAIALIVSLAVTAYAAEILPPPDQREVSKEDIRKAENLLAEVRWDTARVSQHDEIVLSLPSVKLPYIWSLERDVGSYTGIRVAWNNAYFGQGGQELVISTNNRTETGFYLDLINTETSMIIGSATYIYYAGSGINYIPPENRLRGAVDEQGRVVGLYDLYGRHVVADSVYSPDFPNKYVVFSDVRIPHWAQSPIYKLTAAGYMQGYPDGSFRPEAHITRAEFGAVMSRLLNYRYEEGALYDNAGIFADFTDSHWGYGVTNEMLSYLTKEDALSIFGHEFRPNQKITREEVAAVIYAAVKNSGEIVEGNEIVSLNDLNKGRFSDSINYCVSQGLIKGYPDGTFRPDNNITRAEVAAILGKIIGQK